MNDIVAGTHVKQITTARTKIFRSSKQIYFIQLRALRPLNDGPAHSNHVYVQ